MLEIIRSGLVYSRLDISKLQINHDDSYFVNLCENAKAFAEHEFSPVTFYLFGSILVTYHPTINGDIK